MPEPRVRKSDPHRCPACGVGFEVTYLDDRVGERALLPMTIARLACPACGCSRSVSLPAGAERSVRVELSDEAADEGGGG